MSGFDFSLFAQGGPVMWVLAGLALLGVMLFIERALFLHRGQIPAKAFLSGIKNALAKRRLVEALTLCEEAPGPVAAVVKAALLKANASSDDMRFHVQEAAVVELPALERRLGAIAAVAQVAPLVGLLGTIVGMITTFRAFEQGGNYALASALSAGMWQALLTAAGSLMLAIPAHLAHHFLAGRVRAIVRDMEWAGNEIMRYLLTEYRGITPSDGVTMPEIEAAKK
ncbi:MotA/TolQ/ExbB proton channel family protein [Horticoccus sp. 23ND18S-11]|uniref:MotA/TolQ/ExbB proton channel family protein n=1 Tax=Horticoccus sp. 23ND18S-11 TaxID=3391832 RepID=UPI0039C95722